jgi:hypothetical protein
VSEDTFMSDSEYEEKWDAIALQLGHIVIHWSRIEFYLARTFYGITGTSEAVSNVLVRRLGANTLETVILDLLVGLETHQSVPIREWVQSVKKARHWRNSALHSVLADRKDDGEWHPTKLRFGVNADGDAEISGERITPDELREFRTELGRLAVNHGKLPEVARLGIASVD